MTWLCPFHLWEGPAPGLGLGWAGPSAGAPSLISWIPRARLCNPPAPTPTEGCFLGHVSVLGTALFNFSGSLMLLGNAGP